MQTLIHLRANLSARQGLERRVAPEAYFANKVRFARATNRKFLFDFMAVPRVVPQPSDFNNLQCQTSLTALPGAKGIFLRCKTVSDVISFHTTQTYCEPCIPIRCAAPLARSSRAPIR